MLFTFRLFVSASDVAVIPEPAAIVPVVVIVSEDSPVNDGFKSGALSDEVGASDAPFNVIAGVEILPVKTGLANGAFSAKVVESNVPFNVNVVAYIAFADIPRAALMLPPAENKSPSRVIFPPRICPVNVGLANDAFCAKVDASDAPFSVIAGVEMLPVKTGLANGALSAKIAVCEAIHASTSTVLA